MAIFNFDLDLEVVPFQCQMHISVKVHCEKTADNYSFTLQCSLTLMRHCHLFNDLGNVFTQFQGRMYISIIDHEPAVFFVPP